MSSGVGRVSEVEPGRPSSARASLARDALWIAAVATVYFAVARLSLSLLFEPEGIAAIWPPAGIFLSAVLLSRPAARPALVVVLTAADLWAELLAGTPLPVSLAYALVLAGEATLSSYLLLRFMGEPPTFGRARDVLGFVLLSLLFSNGLMALVAAEASLHLPGASSFWKSWLWWATSGGIGNLLVTPFVMSWASWIRTGPGKWSRRRALEGTALLVLLAPLNVAAFGLLGRSELFLLLLPYSTFPFQLWAALRVGIRGVTSATIVLAAIAVAFAAQGRVTSIHETHLATVIVVQLYIAIMAIPTLFLAAVVAERRRTAETLRESEGRLRQAAEAGKVGLWEWDLRTGRVYFSSEWKRQIGYGEQEVTDSFDEFQSRIHPDDAEATLRKLRAFAAGPDSEFRDEFRLRHRDGEYRWILTRAASVHGGRGEPQRILGAHVDITERKRAEQDRDRLRVQFEQAQKMEAVGRLSGGVAHDFNNMLSVILGHAAMALERLDPAEPLRADLEEIERAAQRSAELTRHLLAFARRQTIAPRILDLNETVADALKMLGRLIGENIDLRFVPGKGLWSVKIDPVQIDQILTNLCVNARDAIAEVGAIIIETSNAVFDEAYCADRPGHAAGDHVVLSVTDDGCGMGREIVDHVFEPFFTTKTLGRGTGLGLATVYGIVRQNDGFIDVYSEPGKGTTFRIHLPRFAGQAESRAAPVLAEAPRSQGETVLFVEDEASIRALGKKMLERLGYTVIAAGTPSEAVRVAETYAGEIHLLVTDVVLPEMNGRELAGRIEALRPMVRTLYMSGYTTEAIAHGGVLDDGIHFVQKPFSSANLAKEVREALKRS